MHRGDRDDRGSLLARCIGQWKKAMSGGGDPDGRGQASLGAHVLSGVRAPGTFVLRGACLSILFG